MDAVQGYVMMGKHSTGVVIVDGRNGLLVCNEIFNTFNSILHNTSLFIFILFLNFFVLKLYTNDVCYKY